MKKTTTIKTLAIALLILAPALSFYVFIGLEFEISITQFWGRTTRETTEIKTVIAVNNPTLFSRWLKRVEFNLYINDLKIACEVSEKIVEVKPMQKTEISFTSFLNNSKIADLWVAYVNKGNDFSVILDGNATFNSIMREIICPIGYKTTAHTNLLELLSTDNPEDFRVGPATLTLKSITLTWGATTLNQTQINSNILIFNPNNYPIMIKTPRYILEMNGIKMGEGTINNPTTLEARTNSSIPFTLILNNTMLYNWWTAHLGNDQITRVAIKLSGTAEVLETEYSFLMPEIWAEASIRILGATISLGYYLPIL